MLTAAARAILQRLYPCIRFEQHWGSRFLDGCTDALVFGTPVFALTCR